MNYLFLTATQRRQIRSLIDRGYHPDDALLDTITPRQRKLWVLSRIIGLLLLVGCFILLAILLHAAKP